MKNRVWMTAGLILALGLGACDDRPVEPGASEFDVDLSALEPGLYPILSASDLNAWSPGVPTTVRFHIVDVDTRSIVQSAQGELRFNGQAISVDEVRFPEPFVGAWNEVEPGTLRFAGIALDGLRDAALFELVVRTRDRPTAEDFTVVLEEVVGTDGGQEFSDLTPAVPKRDHPLFSQMPVAGMTTGRR